jgi:hypothetical protein
MHAECVDWMFMNGSTKIKALEHELADAKEDNKRLLKNDDQHLALVNEVCC